MTKEEAIKEAWVKLIPDCTSIDLNNGWSQDVFQNTEIDIKLFDIMPTIIGSRIRPKSLKGIENNNGWIKIESEEDLPKEDCFYYVIYDNGKISESVLHLNMILKNLDVITHYQPIEKPKPSIY